MTFLGSDKLPAIVTLLTVLVGWYVTNIANSLANRSILSYQMSATADGLTRVEISNLSLAKSLTNARFSVICKDLGPCFSEVRAGKPGLAEVALASPVAPGSFNFTLATETELTLQATLTPRSAISFTFRKKDAGREPVFFYVPDKLGRSDLLVVPARSVIAFIVRNYLGALSLVFFASLTALAAFAIGALVRGRNLKEVPKDETAYRLHHHHHFDP